MRAVLSAIATLLFYLFFFFINLTNSVLFYIFFRPLLFFTNYLNPSILIKLSSIFFRQIPLDCLQIVVLKSPAFKFLITILYCVLFHHYFSIIFTFHYSFPKFKIKLVHGVIKINYFYRLTSTYWIIIMFYCTLFVKLGNGPLWRERIEFEQQKCKEVWWANLLYINNYYDTKNYVSLRFIY